MTPSPFRLTIPRDADRDLLWLGRAMRLARIAEKKGEVPVGAIVVSPNGEILGAGFNLRETQHQAAAHAELIAISRASRRIKNWRLLGCTLYVTLEPCIMCCGLIIQSRLSRVVYAAKDPKGGGAQSLYQILQDLRLNHRVPQVDFIPAPEASEILSSFFRRRRKG
ncbi:MAG: tRNA adenosine(34) deaminase TadA [Bdellovibrionaceae bacterium]|nr:tRNA adenosine(34) deaminase TadA [Pseudobdellovibrionaceae bacterium]